MSIHTRIYAAGPIAFGGQPAIDDLLEAAYSAVIVWTVHVWEDGTLYFNETRIVSGGVYKEAEPMELPTRLAQLHKAGIQVIFSVGSADTRDFWNIGQLMKGGVPGPGNVLYDNFKALKDAMVSGGGDIDAIDFDNEDDMDADVMVNFGTMLKDIGYGSVTLCPFGDIEVWRSTYTKLLDRHGKGFVSAIHLQCYAGGRCNSPEEWGEMITKAKGETLLIPGLATVQSWPGPWWYHGKPGSSVVKTPDVAMFEGADWSGMLRKGKYDSADDAMKAVKGGESFFFYCRDTLNLGPGRVFHAGDAVFFAGLPWWGKALQCDAYSLSGGCSNTLNGCPNTPNKAYLGACPSDLRKQYAIWKKEQHAPDGGFIWLYDSIVSCLLSACCGGSEKEPATTAKAYREAITKGLS